MDSRDRINVRTSDEIDNWLYSIEKACHRSGLKFRGRKMTKESLVNSILAAMSQIEVDKVLKHIGEGVAIYEKQIESITDIKPSVLN